MEAETQSIVVIGETGSGKTTLVNALFRWDILPQAVDGMTHPTEACVTLQLAEGFQITDIPGHSQFFSRQEIEFFLCMRYIWCPAHQCFIALSEMFISAEMVSKMAWRLHFSPVFSKAIVFLFIADIEKPLSCNLQPSGFSLSVVKQLLYNFIAHQF